MATEMSISLGHIAASGTTKLLRLHDQRLSVLGGYRLSKSTDKGSGIRVLNGDTLFPQNSFCLECEWGVGFNNLITLPGCTREPHHRDDRDAGHEPCPTPSPVPLAASARGPHSSLDAALLYVIPFGHLSDATRLVFIDARPADKQLAVHQNLQLPGRAEPRMVPEFAAMDMAVRQPHAPQRLAPLEPAARP
jgi:hypothetical protein